MQILTIRALLSKLFLALIAFPPVFIVVKYLRWCNRQEKDQLEHEESDS